MWTIISLTSQLFIIIKLWSKTEDDNTHTQAPACLFSLLGLLGVYTHCHWVCLAWTIECVCVCLSCGCMYSVLSPMTVLMNGPDCVCVCLVFHLHLLERSRCLYMCVCVFPSLGQWGVLTLSCLRQKHWAAAIVCLCVSMNFSTVLWLVQKEFTNMVKFSIGLKEFKEYFPIVWDYVIVVEKIFLPHIWNDSEYTSKPA